MKWDKGQSKDLVEDRRAAPRRKRESSEPPPRRDKRTRRRRKSLPKSGAAAALGLVAAAIAVIVGVVKGTGGDGDDKPGPEPEPKAAETERADPADREDREDRDDRDDTVVDDAELTDFLTFLVNDTNDFWKTTFEKQHKLRYKPAKLVIFDRTTRSRCGRRSARGGPVYCPNDQRMYVPPSFFAELRRKHDAPGDFAQALVIAHEMGHHAQLGMGVTKAVHHKKKGERSKTAALRWKRKQELQADCLAGVWAYNIKKRGRLDPGDVDEAVTAVAAIGDDALQRAAGRKVDRSKWGHGSSAQRVRYFKKGFRKGKLRDCLRELPSPYIK